MVSAIRFSFPRAAPLFPIAHSNAARKPAIESIEQPAVSTRVNVDQGASRRKLARIVREFEDMLFVTK